MDQNFAKDLTALKEWMSKEPHLPQDLANDKILLSFLHSCFYSLEKTKKCIDRFSSLRAQMPEIYTGRDPLSPAMQTLFNNTLIASYRFNKVDQFFIYKYDDPTLETFQFNNVLKSLSIQKDVWLKSCQPLLADENYILLDMKHITFKMIPRINVMLLRDFLVYLLESIPVRVTKLIGINAPSYYDKLYAIVRPVLPIEIQKIIHFYTDFESLYQLIDRKYLPKEYGGEAQSMYEQNQEWCKRIKEEREFLLNEASWTADLKKKTKTSENSMSGSFRTLSFD